MTELRNQIKVNILSSKVISSPFAKNLDNCSILNKTMAYAFAGCENNYCKKYRLELSYNGKKYRFTFHDSIYNYNHNIKLNKLDTIYAVLMDSNSYEDTKSYQEFCKWFGYDEYIETQYGTVVNKEAMKIYEACKKTYEALHNIFSDDELEKLQDEFQDY